MLELVHQPRKFGAVPDLELFVDAMEMDLHGSLGHAKLASHLLVGLALSDQRNELSLSRRQGRQSGKIRSLMAHGSPKRGPAVCAPPAPEVAGAGTRN
jgi:hypothetical protein